MSWFLRLALHYWDWTWVDGLDEGQIARRRWNQFLLRGIILLALIGWFFWSNYSPSNGAVPFAEYEARHSRVSPLR
jgi:hypothetical protein